MSDQGIVVPVGSLSSRTPLSLVRLKQSRWSDLPLDCSLIEFHRRQLLECYPHALVGDNSPWLKPLGGARKFYTAFLSLFVAHAVLFEDFDDGESGPVSLSGFATDTVRPAVEAIVKRFGVMPVVVRLPWVPEMGLYPADAGWRGHGILPSGLQSPD